MTEIVDGFLKALQLIFAGEPMVLEITIRSILVSGSATLLSVLWGLPIATLLGLKRFRGRSIAKGFFHAMMGIPAVALGLVLYLLLSTTGPLGFLDMLYSPAAMMIGQAILITPITISLITSALESVDPEIKDLAETLGASEMEASFAVLKESTSGIILAITASFNRALAELGVALMVGGNIAGRTRVLTTTIGLVGISYGDIEVAIALAIILLMIVSAVSIAANLIQRRGA